MEKNEIQQYLKDRDFDPPAKKGVAGPTSHRAACEFLDWLTQHAKVDGESVVVVEEEEEEDDGL